MSYYDDNGGRGGFLSMIPQAVKSIIIINVLVMIMMVLNEGLMLSWFSLYEFPERVRSHQGDIAIIPAGDGSFSSFIFNASA